VVNAVVDALAELGVEHLEMPVTPERVWSAIQRARSRSQSGSGGTRAST
jgi:carbon-monoxide dehydrogenase large subunit